MSKRSNWRNNSGYQSRNWPWILVYSWISGGTSEEPVIEHYFVSGSREERGIIRAYNFATKYYQQRDGETGYSIHLGNECSFCGQPNEFDEEGSCGWCGMDHWTIERMPTVQDAAKIRTALKLAT